MPLRTKVGDALPLGCGSRVRAGGARIDFANPKEALPFLAFELGKGATPLDRARAVIAAISKGHKFDEELARSNCEVAVHMARRLGLGTGVQRGLDEIYERWDGKGNPRKLAREDIALPARLAQVASQAVLFDRLAGLELAITEATGAGKGNGALTLILLQRGVTYRLWRIGVCALLMLSPSGRTSG